MVQSIGNDIHDDYGHCCDDVDDGDEGNCDDDVDAYDDNDDTLRFLVVTLDGDDGFKVKMESAAHPPKKSELARDTIMLLGTLFADG